MWNEIVKLIEDPSLIKGELDRRLKVARNTDPTQAPYRHLATGHSPYTKWSRDVCSLPTRKDLISLDELRRRSPPLRQREKAARGELQSIADQETDRAAYLRLAETLASFRPPTRLIAHSRCPRSPKNRAPAGQGGLGKRQSNHNPSFHSHLPNQTPGEDGHQTPISAQAITAKTPKLSFAFREYCRRCCQTSCSTTSTRARTTGPRLLPLRG